MMSLAGLGAPITAMSLVVRIGSIGVAISSLESLTRHSDLGPAACSTARRSSPGRGGCLRSASSGHRARRWG
jgi:hypothetical protein